MKLNPLFAIKMKNQSLQEKQTIIKNLTLSDEMVPCLFILVHLLLHQIHSHYFDMRLNEHNLRQINFLYKNVCGTQTNINDNQ